MPCVGCRDIRHPRAWAGGKAGFAVENLTESSEFAANCARFGICISIFSISSKSYS
jgi:hypothetical protein